MLVALGVPGMVPATSNDNTHWQLIPVLWLPAGPDPLAKLILAVLAKNPSQDFGPEMSSLPVV